MYNAVYVTNGGFDAILVRNGTYLIVTPETMVDFINAKENGDDFSEWSGINDWPIEKIGEYEDEIFEAAEMLGEVIAYYEDGILKIRDERRWKERREFFQEVFLSR